MREPENKSQRIIKKLENEIVSLERDYTTLLRKKWKMEDEIRVQKDKINHLEMIKTEEGNKRSMWKKIALILASAWALFLSFFYPEKK
jgi:hypothetical protein